ncbi:hypothetical protein PIB30_061524 [Stylosanthes scabra]|uniref:Uncharacterized protein n=1 Tax=Stylosanthes scabra TaxID=79078 RepID=A0ABU6XJT2_9FABA|nr:hypothetical protein [Stylosanthes scabra]
MRNGSSRRDLLLNSQNFFRSIPTGAENPSLSRLCYRRLWGSRNRRALILGWAYYLDAFSSYPLRTWLPSVYRGHDNWHTRGASFPVLSPTLGTYYSPRWQRADIEVPNLPVDSSSLLPLHARANLRLARGNICTPPLHFGRPTPYRNCLPETVPWPVEVVRIFIDMSISPSLFPRQCPDRYAFRAGRNLPDKEFRYLRTVIIAAAVHRGFGRRLPCHQSPRPGNCDPLCEGAPLLLKLRGYFAEFLRELAICNKIPLYSNRSRGSHQISGAVAGELKVSVWNVTMINVHQGFSKQVMEEAYSYDQGYTPWNPPPYEHHAPRYNVYQSNGYGDAYYGYEDPSPPYPPSQNGIEESLQLLCKERKELWKAQK